MAVLVILLLPGFWSLWIYQGYVTADIEGRPWQTKLFLGLGLGVVNLLLALSVFSLLGWMFPEAAWLGRWAGMIGELPGGGANDFVSEVSLGSGLFTLEFRLFFVLEAVISVVVGAAVIILNRWGWLPTQWLPNLLLRGVGHERTQNENIFNHIEREYTNGRNSLVAIYSIADPSRKKIGIYAGALGKTKEICVSCSEVFREDDPWLRRSESYSYFDLASGVVVDFFPEREGNEGELARYRDGLMKEDTEG